MCPQQNLNQLLWLVCLLLAGELPAGKAEVFQQCASVEKDTFIVAIDDCSSYIYCNGEDSFRDSCPDLTYFDAKAQECAFDDNGVCLKSNNAIALGADEETTVTSEGESQVSTLAPLTTEERSTLTPPATGPSRPHCDANGDGYHPHPQRCEYFYSCIGGYLTIVRCPYNFGWDYAQQQCRPLAETQCFGL